MNRRLQLKTGCAIKPAYVSPVEGIKPYVIHPNELHRAQSTETDSAATNLTS